MTALEDERHAGYRQLHELVKDAPEGVRRAVGNEQQRVLTNGSFALHPSMLLSLLTRAYEQGLRGWFEFDALAGQIDNLERSGEAALPVFLQRTRRIRDRAETVRPPS